MAAAGAYVGQAVPDLQKAEGIILPILARSDARQRGARAKIDMLMSNATRQLRASFIVRNFAWPYLKWRMTSTARRGGRLRDMELQLRPIFQRLTKNTYHANALRRAANAFENIKEHLIGNDVLDLGAGNGLIAQMIQEHTSMKVTLADVIDYSIVQLPVILFPQGGRIPMDDSSVDTVLIYLVLHHAAEPLQVLDEAVRVSRKRLIIMEGYIDDEDTRTVNCFLDWFLNRVVQGVDINLPLNFRTTVEWDRIFADRGLRVIKQDVVGVDEPIAPESHVLFVLDKQGD
jgi:SAM-dependent methyltransferase